MDTTTLVRQAAAPNLPPLARGYIVPTRAAPTSFSEGVFVVLPEGSTEALYGPCKWGAIHGTAKPQPGAACVVAFDEQNQPVVVWWEGTQVTPGGTEYFAGEGLELKNLGGKETFKINPEVLIKTTEQTVTGRKTFQQSGGNTVKPLLLESVTPPEEAVAVSGGAVVEFKIASGNINSVVAASPAAGGGGQFSITTGTGGTTSKATTTQKGGPGGNYSVTTGVGGAPPGVEGAVKAVAGEGGTFQVTTGAGGITSAVAAATGILTSGNGGLMKFLTGKGGSATGAAGVPNGGSGGVAEFKTGAGGAAEASEVAKPKAGSGGTLKFETGEGATAIGTEPIHGSGGKVQVILGQGGNNEEVKSGTFTVYWQKAEATRARFEVTPEGFLKAQKSIGLWEHAPPAAKPASISPEEVTVKIAMERIDKVLKEYGITS